MVACDHEMLQEFNALETFEVNGKKYFVVENNKQRQNFEEIISAKVVIDSEVFKVCGVERCCHCAPWRRGEKITLMVEKL